MTKTKKLLLTAIIIFSSLLIFLSEKNAIAQSCYPPYGTCTSGTSGLACGTGYSEVPFNNDVFCSTESSQVCCKPLPAPAPGGGGECAGASPGADCWVGTTGGSCVSDGEGGLFCLTSTSGGGTSGGGECTGSNPGAMCTTADGTPGNCNAVGICFSSEGSAGGSFCTGSNPGAVCTMADGTPGNCNAAGVCFSSESSTGGGGGTGTGGAGVGTGGAGAGGAAPTAGGVYWPTSAETGLPDPAGGVKGIIGSFMNWLLGIFGLLAIIAFVVSGIQYLAAAGSERVLETAKRNMTYSIIGVIVALAAFVIIQAVDRALRMTPMF